VQDGKLDLLQCRIGKRSPLAKAVIAVDLMKEGLRNAEETKLAISKADLRAILIPSVDPGFKVEPAFVGIPSNNGVAVGKVCITSEQAVHEAQNGPVVLVTTETDPDDIEGMNASVGILTRTGGATSHAAVVARALNKPCVVGCTALPDDLSGYDGQMVTIDGTTGRVWVNATVPVIGGGYAPALAEIAKLFLEPGQVMQSDGITPGYGTAADILNRVIDASKITLLDMRSRVKSQDDEVEALFPAVSQVSLTGEQVDWANTEVLVAAGFEDQALSVGMKVASVKEAETLEAMLDMKTTFASPALIKKLGAQTYKKLTKVLTETGFTDGTRTVFPVEYILFRNLQGV
jgi:phosphohistidine swiveling domain-containing protein